MSRPRLTLPIVRLVVLGALLLVVAIAVVVMGVDRAAEVLEEAANSQWGVVGFIALYVVGVVLLVPGTIGTVTSGVVLGFAVGFPVALLSSTAGATLAFFVARNLGREGAEQLLDGRLTSLDEWIGNNDFLSILVARLMPIVPFNLFNYASGLSSVRPTRYVAGTALGMIPGTALTTFAASRARDPSSMAFLFAAAALLLTVILSTMAAKRVNGRRR